MVKYIPLEAKSILNRHRFIDDWTAGKSSMNLYRGCEHACVYCDGRSEKYQVNHDFGEEIRVKINAPEILRKELAKIEKPEIIMLGGGVGDLYQPAEEKFSLTRKALALVKEFNLSCQILTKSVLIERDFDLICALNQQKQAIVCFSISSLDEEVWRIFEPRTSSPRERLRVLKLFNKANVPTGVWFMPIIPFICDDTGNIEEVVKACRAAGIRFMLPAGMTLKEGRQKEYFIKVLAEKFPQLVPEYKKLYPGSKWGSPSGEYNSGVMRRATKICHQYGFPTRIPYELFRDKIELRYEISIVLSQIAYLLELKGKKGQGYRRVAFNLQKQPYDLIEMKDNNRLREIPGVGEVIARLIQEIIEERKCKYYEKLWREVLKLLKKVSNR